MDLLLCASEYFPSSFPHGSIAVAFPPLPSIVLGSKGWGCSWGGGGGYNLPCSLHVTGRCGTLCGGEDVLPPDILHLDLEV